MSTRRKLPGLELLGANYDVTGYFADARSVEPLKALFSLDLSTYDPDSDPAPASVTIAGTTYYYPSTISAISINSSQVIEQTTKSVTDFEMHLNVSASAGGWYEGFYGSVEASFDAAYRTSTSFYSLTHMGLLQTYSITMPALADLQNRYLTPEASSDINGVLSPALLVAKYGAFFLTSGIFGGALNYSQSISRYSVETQAAAAAKVSANYLGFVNASMSASVQTDSIATSEQSNGHFEAKGGSADQLQRGYSSWASSLLATGDFALVNFNKHSLSPLWVLAESPQRQEAIRAYIESAMSSTPPNLQALGWNRQSNTAFLAKGSSKDNIEKQLTLASSTQVIVGVACSAKNDDVSRLALRVLDLADNSIAWITDDGSVYNQSNYQRIADIPAATGQRGVAVTGVGMTCTNHVVSAIWLHYQLLNPADGSTRPTYLQSVVNTFYSGDSAHEKSTPEVDFKPDAGAGRVITGIGLRIKSDNFTDLKLWQAPLITTAVSAAAADRQALARDPQAPVDLG